jgi:phage gp46-like protein
MLSITFPQRAMPPGLAPPDIAWTGTSGDFVEDPVIGLISQNPIRTAIIMLLFTHAACEPSELRFEHAGDRRGWAGDSFGIDPRRGEQPLGSTLWLLRREKLDAKIARRAEVEAVRALQPLIRQKLAASVAATGTIAGRGDKLDLAILLQARDGRPVFSDRFDVLWKAAA